MKPKIPYAAFTLSIDDSSVLSPQPKSPTSGMKCVITKRKGSDAGIIWKIGKKDLNRTLDAKTILEKIGIKKAELADKLKVHSFS